MQNFRQNLKNIFVLAFALVSLATQATFSQNNNAKDGTKSKLIYHVYTPENSVLPIRELSGIYPDSLGNVNFISLSGIVRINKETDTLERYYYVPDSSYGAGDSKSFAFDKYGTSIKYELVDWENGKLIFQNIEKKIKYSLEGNAFLFATNYVQIDDHLYLTSQAQGNPYLRYLLYNEGTERWEYDKKQVYELNRKDCPLTYESFKLGRKLYIPSDSGMIIYNHDTKSHKIWKDPAFDLFRPEKKGVVLFSAAQVNEQTKVATMPIVAGKRLKILKIYGEDSVKVWTLPKVLHPSLETGKGSTNTLGFFTKTACLDKAEKTYCTVPAGQKITWSEEKGFKSLPMPAQEVLDTLAWMTPTGFYLKSDDSLYMATWYGIVLLNPKELIATGVDKFRYEDFSSVEDDSRFAGIPMMEIYGLRPLPAKNYLDVRYFLDTKSFGTLQIKIFDTSGKEYFVDNTFEIKEEIGIDRTIRINIGSSLPAGVYLLQLNENGYSCSKTFVIE